MNTEHPISNEVLDLAKLSLMKGEHFMAYNNSLYFIEKEDVHFFKREEDAVSFAYDNSSDYDKFNVIAFHCISDILKHIPYSKQLSDQLRLDPDTSGLYNKDGNDFTDALIEHFESRNNATAKIEIQAKLLNSKTNFMNEKFLADLKNNLKYMGFGDKLYEQLEMQMAKGEPKFQLNLDAEINDKKFTALLNFKKSDTTDRYFFNSYHATLERKDGAKVDQVFYLNEGKGITAKEAFNLLDGRAVHKELTNKEGVEYKAWVQIDFEKKDKNNNHEVKQFHENYGYVLKDAVTKFAITELADPSKAESLFHSLQKGNIQSVNMDVNGETKKMFIEANPQYKAINVYDAEMKRVQKEELVQFHSVQQSPNKEVKQEQKEEIAKNNKKGVKQKPGSDLLGTPKKSERKNGMSV